MADEKPTWNTIKRYFRGVDIAMMRDEVDRNHDLDNYDDVKRSSPQISRKVASDRKNEIMPPPPYAPWDEKMKATFNKWATASPPLEVDPELQKQAEPFVKLSELLTGFTGLNQDPDLALKYLERLRNRSELKPVVNDLIEKHAVAADEDQFVADVLEGPEPKYKEVATVIILLWYTGGFFENGFPSDFGDPKDNQYIDGLVWLAIQAHPMAYSTEGKQYWSKKPKSSGRNTGLGGTAKRPKPKEEPPTLA